MSASDALARISMLQSRVAPSRKAMVPLGGWPTKTASSGSTDSTAAASGSFSSALTKALGAVGGNLAASPSSLGSSLGSSASGGSLISSSLDWTGSSDSVPSGTPYGDLFTSAARRNGLSPKLLAAVSEVESSFRTDAVSSTGAQGLMQFMPGTAAAMGVNPADPSSAIDGAARLIAGHLARFGNISSALAAYNQGSATVMANGGLVPAAAQNYVDKVLARVRGVG